MALALVTTVLSAARCDREAAQPPQPASANVRIGSFNFAESEMLAELYAQAVEQRGIPVERLGRIGSREVVQPALELGLIDVVPEYAGTMLSFVSLRTNEPTSDRADTMAELRATLDPRGMVALEPAEAQNRNTFIVIRSFAVEHDLRTISDLAPVAGAMTFGGPSECPERDFCLVGLRDLYAVEFGSFIPMPSSPVVADGLRSGEIDVGLLFSTDPMLLANDIVVLRDDLGLQPAENVVPVVRADALERWGPDLSLALNEVSADLNTIDLAVLNFRFQEEPSEAAAIAQRFLAE